MYLAYLKYGFSRATSDTSIEIRHKRMSREVGMRIVKKFDSVFPSEYLNDYCKYFSMTKKEFFYTLQKFKNKSIFNNKIKKLMFV